MVKLIPEQFQYLLNDETKAIAAVCTVFPDGSPQVTLVWFNTDGEHILFNTVKGRAKDRNLRRDPRVAVAITDPGNPYRYIQIRGRVVEITGRSADGHINELARKYTGRDFGNSGQVRVEYKILPEHVSTYGE